MHVKLPFLRSGIIFIILVTLVSYIFWEISPDSFINAFNNYDPQVLLTVTAVFILTNILAVVRLHFLLGYFRFRLQIIDSFKASIAGYLSGLIVFQLVGQLLGRRYYLRAHGVEPSAIVLLSFYERVVGLLVSGILCITSFIYLYAKHDLLSPVRNLSLIDIGATIFLAMLANVIIARSSFEKSLLSSMLSTRSLLQFTYVLAQTVVIQATTIFTFYLALKGLALEVSIIQIMAAAAIVSFAASLPISINGWGVREVASMYAFGLLGVSAADAVLAAVTVGASSTLAVLILAPILTVKRNKPDVEKLESLVSSGENGSHILSLPIAVDSNKALSWILSLGLAVLIFFQIHIRVGGGILNVNLADPLAILVLGYFILTTIQSRSLPHFRPPLVVLFWAGASAVVLLGFMHGVWSFGLTDWALKNRLVGWVILLGYALTGHSIVSIGGKHGLRRLVETLAVTAVVVILFTIVWRALMISGVELSGYISPNFEGYSSNRNAFSFLLLCIFCAGVAYLPVYENKGLSNRWLGVLTIIMFGVYLTQSRTGIIVLFVIVMASPFLGAASKAIYIRLVMYCITSYVLYVTLLNAPIILKAIGSFLGTEVSSILNLLGATDTFRFVQGTSDIERWDLLVQAYSMWEKNPLFGAGLGALMNDGVIKFGNPTLAHNSVMWLLAEMGIVGTAVFLFFFLYLFKNFYSNARHNHKIYAVCGTLLLGAFALFSQAHEVLYQRPLWLLLGALVSSPAALLSSRSR